MFFLGVPPSEIPPSRLFAANPETRDRSIRRPPSHGFRTPQDLARCALSLPRPRIQSSLDLQPLFIGAPGEDLSAFQPWTTRNLPLAETKQLLRGAQLFLGNDSGPAHMAAAFQIPSVVFFGPSDPVVWAPWRTPSEILVSPADIDSNL